MRSLRKLSIAAARCKAFPLRGTHRGRCRQNVASNVDRHTISTCVLLTLRTPQAALAVRSKIRPDRPQAVVAREKLNSKVLLRNACKLCRKVAIGEYCSLNYLKGRQGETLPLGASFDLVL